MILSVADIWDDAWSEISSRKVLKSLPSGYEWISDFKSCWAALTDPTLLSSIEEVHQVNLKHNLLFMDGSKHAVLRNRIVRALQSKLLSRARLRFIATGVIEGVQYQDQYDLVQDFAVAMATQVACDFLGCPQSDAPLLAATLEPTASLFDPSVPGDDKRTAIANIVELMRYFHWLLKHDAVTPDGAMASLASYYSTSERNWTELLTTCVVLAHAAVENTTNFLSFAGASILTDGRIRNDLASDSTPRRRRTIDELLRVSTPARILIRRATHDVHLEHQLVPSGRGLVIAIGQANRDPLRFDLPDKANLTTESTRHLAFGTGAHACLGARIARDEADALLTDFSRKCLGDVEWSETVWKDNLIMFGPHRMVVASRPRAKP